MAGNRLLALSLTGLLAGIAGCSSSPHEEEVLGDATIVSFTATPTAVDRGGASTLKWTVSDATGLALAEEGGAVIELGPAALDARAIEVRPERTTRYVLSATGRSGRVVIREAKVAVRAAQPRIVSFSATSVEVEPGKPVTLSWATENADAMQIVAKDGSAVDVHGASPAEGSVTVHPGSSTTYTLRAWSEIGWAEATLDVSVVGGLDVELVPDRALVEFGETTFLRWRSRGAERVVLRSGGAVLVDTRDEPSGVFAIAPETVTTYVVEAHAGGQVVTAEAEVRALPAIESFGPVGTGPFARGANVDLHWKVRGATTLKIRAAGGYRFQVGAGELDEGTTTAVIPADGRFEIEATLDDETIVRTLSLPLLDPPAVVSFAVTPDRLTVAGGDTAEVSFSWQSARASEIEIAPIGGAPVFTSTSEAASGTAKVRVDRSATYVLTARNVAGEATSRADVRVYAPAAIEAFTAQPAHVGAGEAFELSWITRAASSVRLEQDGVTIRTTPGGNDAGSFTTQLAAGSTFRLVAANGAGETAERTLRVSVGPPVLTSFTVERERFGPGSTARFSWAAVGGTSLALQGPGGASIASCSTTDLSRIPAGECIVDLPTSLGPRSYTLTLANGLGQKDVRTVEIEIVDGPTIAEFFADKSRITLGEPLTFFWTTGVDGDGNPPQLSLADGSDAFPLGAADPLHGSVTVTPLRSGNRTFRLTAASAGRESSSRDVVIEVLEPPTLQVNAASTVFVPDLGPVELGWQTTHAIELSVEEVDDGGASRRIGLFVDPALVASGRIEVVPPAPGRLYRFVAVNAARSTVTREVTVGWELPEVADFFAAPGDVAIGSTAQLHWNTVGASSVTIAPTPLVEAADFLDVSGRPSAAEVILADCGTATLPADGCALVQLPFAFPWAGVPRTQARVYLHGVLGFDASYTGASLPVVQLPSATASFVDLAPFWQPLRQSVQGATRTGRIFMAEDEGADGRSVVIQWKGFWAEGATSAQPADLNFEIVLFENGDFDFRYERMSGATPAWANGRNASVGHQSQGGAAGRSVSFQRASDRGWSQTSLGFRPGPLPLAGSLPVVPLFLGKTTYTLTATSLAGSSTATASVEAHAPATLSGVRVVEAFPLPNQLFTVAWTATNASEVRVERPQADFQDPIVVLCSARPEQAQSCQVQESTVGVHSYVVRALGFGVGDEPVVPLDVEVFPPFSIDSFTADADVVTVGDEVTLEWTTTNADTLELTKNGAAVDIAGLPRSSGSISVRVDVDTTFVLTATSRGRTSSETVSVTAEEPEPEPEPDEE